MINYTIVLRRDAQTDLDEIIIWYEEQQQRLGFEFIYEFEITLRKILRNPFYASFFEADARGASLKKFPYQVIYRIDEDTSLIRIIAIIHQHRNPTWFKKRL